MNTRSRKWQMPLRLRLTLWYTLSLGLILLLFSGFLYVQVRRSLITQVDAALVLAANQAVMAAEGAGGGGAGEGVGPGPLGAGVPSDDFVVHFLANDGTVLATQSADDEAPLFARQPEGFSVEMAEGEPWRVYRQVVTMGEEQVWVQAAQELDPVVAALGSLQTQILWGIPLGLLLAGLGGYFLASRALRPIGDMTETAAAISAGDLTQRIHYQGAADEVGRLAGTFDQMLDRLQAAFERERRFTADAAHELRTPLTALKGRIGVTLSQSRQAASYVETLQEMEKQVDRLIRLSSDLLFMARLDRQQVKPQMERLNGPDFLGAVADQIRPLARAKEITLEIAAEPGFTIYGDMDLLIRLLLNLLDNAVKYTPEKGQVTLEGKDMEAGVQIVVRDSGPGIDPQHMPHLFERFYRAEGDRGRQDDRARPGGAGLGLAMVYEIARAHAGTVMASSTPGEGTVFTVQLPKAESGEQQR